MGVIDFVEDGGGKRRFHPIQPSIQSASRKQAIEQPTRYFVIDVAKDAVAVTAAVANDGSIQPSSQRKA